MIEHMGITEVLGLAASVSLLSGWRIYLSVLATGLAMRYHIVPLPSHVPSLAVLANGWVLGAAGFAATCEFFADKVPWLDSIWDLVHTLIRPLGGAMLALALVNPGNPTMQAVAFILGGGGALLAHGAKAGSRAVINASPEPFSNILVSTAEDAATSGMLYTVFHHPYAASGIAAVVFVGVVLLMMQAKRIFGQVFGKRSPSKIS